MWLFSLRTRLILANTGLVLLGFGGLALVAGQQVSTAAEADFDHHMESEVQIVARALAEPVENYLEGELQQQDITDILNNYSHQTDAQLTLINNNGDAWLTSAESLPPDDFARFPEIIAARDGRTIHETRRDQKGEWVFFAAAPVVAEGRVVSVVQLAASFAGVQTAIRQRWLALGGAITVLALLTAVVSAIMATSLLRPLELLRRSTLRVSEGDFSIHLPIRRRDEIGQVAQTFNNMVERVRLMLEEQRTFASNASHELRTPLTTIRLRSEYLRDQRVDESTSHRYLTEVTEEAARMAQLIDDLILLSRFDSGLAEIGQELVDVDRFARLLVQELTPAATERLVQIVLEIASMPLPSVWINLNHLRVIFRNLLDNAIKYMPEEGGTVNWRIETVNDRIVFTVADTGKGIASEEMPHILKRFYRADKSRSRAVSGTGLGLSLVQSVVQAYKGQLTIRSSGAGQGTTAIVILPIQSSNRSEFMSDLSPSP